MSRILVACVLAGILLALPALAAEETIAISDSLAANADPMSVKRGSQWFGQMSKWHIGDYAVMSSKLSATNIASKSNLLKTKTERHSMTRFQFVMRNTTADSVSVQVVRHAMDESTHEFKITKSVGLGSNELLQASDSCHAIIVVNGDTTATWTLLKASITAPALGYEAILTNGTRTVLLVPVTADVRTEGKRRGFFSRLAVRIVPPAMGYEFFEDERSIAALQTFGGTSKKNPRLVWLHRGLDVGTKLVLVAAMTTVLQVESSSTGLEPPDEE